MTPTEQNIAIAEACGLTNVKPVVVQNVAHQGDDRTVGISSDSGWIPDYLSDLNAMHEAEKTLTKEQRRKYVRTLFQTTNTDWDSHCATAAQRAEAFLRTLGKWKANQ